MCVRQTGRTSQSAAPPPFTVDGVRVAVIGIMNEEAPTLVTPGALGTIQIANSIAAANKAAARRVTRGRRSL